MVLFALVATKAIDIVNDLFPSKDLSQQASHTIHVGIIKDKEAILDEVVISIYKDPRSYTGEDVVEISGHGSPFVLQQIINACIQVAQDWQSPGSLHKEHF